MTPDDWPKARGARSNPRPRFHPLERETVDDGWDQDPDAGVPPLPTSVRLAPARSIISRNDSPDIPFNRSINPYRGCAHGCVYCFARPGHAYLDLSPGLDFETKLLVKPNAAQLLETELRHPRYRAATLAIGTNTDPYQPIERRYGIMRACLQVLAAFHHPVSIVTKGHLVIRDIDILAPMAAQGLASVAVSVTTLDRDLHRRLEPRAATPAKRLEAIRRLAEAGIPTAVMAAPMIPRINDHELEAILTVARRAGARAAGCILLRLPHEVKDLFADWLAVHFPDRAGHVLSLISQQRGGKLYRATFGERFSGSGPHADLLSQRFRLAARRLGLSIGGFRLDASQFRPPPRPGEQLTLFD